MWIIQEPTNVALWNKRHFEEKNGECAACLKYSVLIVVEKNIYIKCNICRVAVRPSYIYDGRFLKVNEHCRNIILSDIRLLSLSVGSRGVRNFKVHWTCSLRRVCTSRRETCPPPLSLSGNALYCSRDQLECDATRWRTGGEVKGKLANGVGSQYPSHYFGTLCI
jgi:hypothetical protein